MTGDAGKISQQLLNLENAGKLKLKQLFGDLRNEDERAEAGPYPRSFATTVLPHVCLSKVGKNNGIVYIKGTVA